VSAQLREAAVAYLLADETGGSDDADGLVAGPRTGRFGSGHPLAA